MRGINAATVRNVRVNGSAAAITTTDRTLLVSEQLSHQVQGRCRVAPAGRWASTVRPARKSPLIVTTTSRIEPVSAKWLRQPRSIWRMNVNPTVAAHAK